MHNNPFVLALSKRILLRLS